MNKPPKRSMSRRDALKALAGITGAVAISSLPNKWSTPLVNVGALPAFAQCSPTDTTAAFMVANLTDGTAVVQLLTEQWVEAYELRVGPFGLACQDRIAPGSYILCHEVIGGACPVERLCRQPEAMAAGGIYELVISCLGDGAPPIVEFKPKPLP